jgi:hypothetical protein
MVEARVITVVMALQVAAHQDMVVGAEVVLEVVGLTAQ